MTTIREAPASGNDLSQPADAKSKSHTDDAPPGSTNISKYFQSYANSLAQDFLPRFTLPTFMTDTQFLVINSVSFREYFVALYASIMHALYPDGWYSRNRTPTEDAFTFVCRLIVKSRCDYVYESVRGIAAASRIPCNFGSKIPASLGLVVNSIGLTHIINGAVAICPQPEEIVPGTAAQLHVTNAQITAVYRLFADAESKGVIRTTTVSREVHGTPWYTLGAYDAVRGANAAGVLLPNAQSLGTTDNVVIKSCHSDASLLDINLAAIVQRQFNGNIAIISDTTEFTSYVNDVLGRREAFNIGA